MRLDMQTLSGKLGDDVISHLSRRNFLISAVGSAVTFGLSAADAHASMEFTVGDFKPSNGQVFDPSVWFSLDETGVVTINIKNAEMGQHIGSALVQILADELEVEWSNVRMVQVDSDPKWGNMQTGGSWSVWQTWPMFIQVGAAGRTALIAAGAELLGVPVDQCHATRGTVQGGGKTVAYGDIVKSGKLANVTFTPEQLKTMVPKPASERHLIGKAVQQLDIRSKTNGTARFGIDAEIEGMVYARPVMPPTREKSKVLSVDDSAAKAIKGYQQYLIIEDPTNTVTGWVLAIADSYYAAYQAAPLIKVTYQPGPMAKTSEKDLLDEGARLIADPTVGTILNTGDHNTAPVFKTAKVVVEKTYTTNTVLHMQLEPVNATAVEKDGMLEIHTGSQWQTLILPILAKSLGRPENTIVMRTYLLGGAFGRRLNGDYTIPAAHAAVKLGKPVKLLLARPDDALFDSVRTCSVQTLRMAFGDVSIPPKVLPQLSESEEEAMYDSIRTRAIVLAGQQDANSQSNVIAPPLPAEKNPMSVLAMEFHACAGWPTKALVPSGGLAKGLNGQYDPYAISGADHWYSVGAQLVRTICNEMANETCHPGYLRSVSAGWTCFALESFIDEAALEMKVDPLTFRLNLLKAEGRNAGTAPNSVGGANRLANVLHLATQKAGWGKTQLPPDTAMGLACSMGQERTMPTWIAGVVQLHVDRKSGRVDVQKMTLVIDAGTVIDPDGALAQSQGAALWGLSLALFEGSAYENGQVVDTNLDTYSPVRIANVPELDISFVQNTFAPMGLGEPALTVIAPAIANAIYNAVGVRFRHLPIKPADVKAALAKK